MRGESAESNAWNGKSTKCSKVAGFLRGHANEFLLSSCQCIKCHSEPLLEHTECQKLHFYLHSPKQGTEHYNRNRTFELPTHSLCMNFSTLSSYTVLGVL